MCYKCYYYTTSSFSFCSVIYVYFSNWSIILKSDVFLLPVFSEVVNLDIVGKEINE